jgi:hypothetical protein
MKGKILTLFLLSSLYFNAQTVDFLGTKIDVTNVCNSLGFSDNNEAKKYIDEICSAAGIKSNFIVVPCNSIKTCLAFEKEGDPYIIYDNIFLKNIKTSISYGFTEKKINSNSNKYRDWEVLTILAHEIGHHANNHFSKTVRNNTSIKEIELEADEYAGQIIYRLGGELQEGKKVYNSDLIPIKPTLEHPGRADRIKAFQEGYNKAKGLDSKSILNSTTIDSKKLLIGNWLDETKELTTSFYDDESFIIAQKDKSYEGKWKLENSEITFILTNSESKWVSLSIIGLNPYTLTLKDEESNSISVLKRNNVSASEYSNNYLKKNWSKLIYVEKYDYTFREIGGLWDINIPLVNNSDFDIDLVRVRVDYYLKNYFGNGGIYKSEYLDFKNLKSHQKIILKAPDSDRGTSVKTKIIKINSKNLNLQ